MSFKIRSNVGLEETGRSICCFQTIIYKTPSGHSQNLEISKIGKEEQRRAKQAFDYHTESLLGLGRTVNKNTTSIYHFWEILTSARSPFARREEPEPKSSMLQLILRRFEKSIIRGADGRWSTDFHNLVLCMPN
jgi:hypothetical protein